MKDSNQAEMAGKDAELGSSINEKAIVRKLNKHILLKFFLMCILCYIGEALRSIQFSGWGDVGVMQGEHARPQGTILTCFPTTQRATLI